MMAAQPSASESFPQINVDLLEQGLWEKFHLQVCVLIYKCYNVKMFKWA